MTYFALQFVVLKKYLKTEMRILEGKKLDPIGSAVFTFTWIQAKKLTNNANLYRPKIYQRNWNSATNSNFLISIIFASWLCKPLKF